MAAGTVDGDWTTTMATVGSDYRGQGAVASAGRRWQKQPQNRADGGGTAERWQQQSTSDLDGGGGDVRWLEWAATEGRPSAVARRSE